MIVVSLLGVAIIVFGVSLLLVNLGHARRRSAPAWLLWQVTIFGVACVVVGANVWRAAS